jgi:hypothetical protein
MAARPYTPYNPGQQGYGYSYRGSYGNLPAGITNAGDGRNSAYTREVQPNELVSNQLQGLLDSNSPYMQNARMAGLNQANSRGLLNSSIAAGSSQAAAIGAGMPIAAADAAAYGGAAGQNLDALNAILKTNLDNRAGLDIANVGAGASMYGADLQLRNQREQRDYLGQQAGLDRGYGDYMEQMRFGNSLRRDAFNLGGNLLQQNNQFRQNAYLSAMDNPFIMQNPEALAGYTDFASQNNQSYYDNLFGFATNAGQPGGAWYENSDWYTSPYEPYQGAGPYPNYYGGGY